MQVVCTLKYDTVVSNDRCPFIEDLNFNDANFQLSIKSQRSKGEYSNDFKYILLYKIEGILSFSQTVFLSLLLFHNIYQENMCLLSNRFLS